MKTKVKNEKPRKKSIEEMEEWRTEEWKRQRQRLKAKRLAEKRRKRKQFFCRILGIFIGIALLLLVKELDLGKRAGQFLSQSVMQIQLAERNRSQTLLYETKYVDFLEGYQPQVFEEAEVFAKLKELSKQYKELEQIYEERESYPIKLLSSLCNNPELTDYVKGYLAYESGDKSVAKEAKLTGEEKRQKYPLFLQWDKRWGYEAYGDFNIALSGCGPTTLSMAVVSLTGDTSVTPNKVAEYSMEAGYYVEGTGTAWSLMTEGCEHFGIKAEETVLDEGVMKRLLDDGKVMICSMRPGDFTAVGHFLLIYAYDESGFWINDSNCIYRSSRPWTYEELKSQIRILWAYEKG